MKSVCKHDLRKCAWCDKEFVPTSKVNIFCSPLCRNSFKHFKKSKKAAERDKHHVCKYCGKPFVSKKANQVFCSNACHFGWIDNIGTHEKSHKARVYKVTLIKYLELIKKCVVCGWEKNIHIHHIVPRSQGGKNEVDNYMPLCCNCHQLLHQTKDLKMVKAEIESWAANGFH